MGLTMGLATLISMYLSYKVNEWSGHNEPGMSQLVHGFFHGAYSLGLPAAGRAGLERPVSTEQHDQSHHQRGLLDRCAWFDGARSCIRWQRLRLAPVG